VLLLAGLGTPRQERWLARHLAALGGGVAMGIGGSLDVWAGRARRAPRLMQALGLEWLYRLAHEPRRLRRQLTIPHFMALVVAKRAREACAARRAERTPVQQKAAKRRDVRRKTGQEAHPWVAPQAQKRPKVPRETGQELPPK
jgi:Glycosyl transferase WecG/TagA/CpsF family